MKKWKVISIIIVYIFVGTGIYAQDLLLDSIGDPIELLRYMESKNPPDSILLDKYALVNKDLEAIFYNTTKNIKSSIENSESSSLCFYITFMKCDKENFYFEIWESYTNQSLFTIRDKINFSAGERSERIIGYYKYKSFDFFILLYPEPCMPEEIDICDFFKKTTEKILIHWMPLQYYPFNENPSWVYKYEKGRINLISSLNDKGFFTNP